jgi:RND family efflux transporter MFP subunit
MVFSILLGCGKNRRSGSNTKQSESDLITVITKTVQPETIYKYTKITGKLEGKTNIIFTSEISGKVIEINKELGNWINKGESIGTTDNREAALQLEQAEANVLSAEVVFDNAERDLKAAKNLLQTKDISQTEYQNQLSNYKTAQANLKAANANLKLMQRNYDAFKLTAPVSGFITYLPIQIGELINQGSTVCKIVDSSQLIINTSITENEVINIEKNDTVYLRNKTGKIGFTGKVVGVGTAPKPNSNNYPLKILVDNAKQELIVGMVVTGKIKAHTYKNALAISINNTKTHYDDTIIYTVDADNIVHENILTYTDNVEDLLIIQSGISFGDRIIIENSSNLQDGQKVEIKEI